MRETGFPEKQGLYDPQFEHDSCGVGFVCNVKGSRSNKIIKQGLEVLDRLSHRGAVGADPDTGDGAGILIQMPHKFFSKVCSNSGIDLPKNGEYGTGLVFLPQDKKEREFCEEVFKKVIDNEGQRLLGWRDVPVDGSSIGKSARDTQPVIKQVFIKKSIKIKDQLAFERKLYVIRKVIESDISASGLKEKSYFYITNLSSRTFSYKGLLMPHQLEDFFVDLKDKSVKSAICLVHSRYSTNTFPTWDLAQPFRFLAHNGEINTLRGNINWMRAREGLLKSEIFGKDIEKIKPVVVPGGSDSATIDNVLELLVLSGRSVPLSMMMLIPPAWEGDRSMDRKLKDFYKYQASSMEPWDGPAAIAFTDGTRIAAILDRNGLRPARYIVTKDDFVVMASEVGVLDIDPKDIKASGRLEPGKMLFINTERGRIISDEEVKREVANKKPYGSFVREHMIEFSSLRGAKRRRNLSPDCFAPLRGARKDSFLVSLKAFGYTREDLKILIRPMAESGVEPTGSMGNDAPHAVLSKRPQSLFTYFKQLFAQVTNPAIDPIREELVMSLESIIGPQKNLLEETPEHANRLLVKEPILSNDELEKIRHIKRDGFKTKTISTLFEAGKEADFKKALDRICREATGAIKKGYSFIVMSDRGIDKNHAALPSLLAISALHHCLIGKGLRTQIGIIVESGEPREVHHFALLFAYGADCINPYLAIDSLKYLIDEGELDLTFNKAFVNYRKAVNKGILKVLSKMGISTLRSYRGAQIFEALGISDSVIEKYFTGTVSRIGGVGLEEIRHEALLKHKEAYPDRDLGISQLPGGGVYQWRRDGEFH
ncbi:MAG: glutamate synthase central domain-containing protein, partial [Candidatus Omnitrophota bacterium]